MLLTLGILVPACELPDNVDPKAAVKIKAEAIFANALRDGISHIDDMNQNVNVSRFLCQYSSQAQYPDPGRYHFSDRQIPDG